MCLRLRFGVNQFHRLLIPSISLIALQALTLIAKIIVFL